jgi:hypothetical protein
MLYLDVIKNKNVMKEIKEMIDSAMTTKEAREMLNLWYSFGKISKAPLDKGKKYVKNLFE